MIFKIKSDLEQEIDNCLENIDIDFLIKKFLILAETMFSSSNNKITTLQTFMDNILSKEEILEGFSYLISRKIAYLQNEVNLYYFLKCDLTAATNKYPIFKDIVDLSNTRHKIKEMALYVEKEQYKQVIEDNLLKIDHEMTGYQYYDKFGYLMDMLKKMSTTIHAVNDRSSNVREFLKISSNFEYTRPIDYIIKDEGKNTEAIIFDFKEDKLSVLIHFLTASHDAKYNQMQHKYFTNSQIGVMDLCDKEKSNIRWFDLLNLSVVLEYIALFVDQIIEENALYERIANNSRINIKMSDERLLDFFYYIFKAINSNITRNDVTFFLKSFTTNLTTLKKGTIVDIQFRPIIKIEDTNVLLFNVFANTDIVRAFITNYNEQFKKLDPRLTVVLDDQGDKFENVALNLITTGFPAYPIFSSIEYETKEVEGDIDIVMVGNKNIYFIECKNRISPFSAGTSTTHYQYIQKGIKQLNKGEKYFNKNRLMFVKNHLKISINDINDYKLHKILLLSNANVSGLNHDGIAVRDIESLSRLIHEGKIVMHEIDGDKKTSHEITLYENGITLQEIDFLNYISKESIFFKNINHGIEKHPYVIQYKDYKIEDYMLSFDFMKYDL